MSTLAKLVVVLGLDAADYDGGLSNVVRETEHSQSKLSGVLGTGLAAVGGVTSLETAVDGISSTVNAYGDKVITATQASDLMFTAVKVGKTTFDELSKSLFNVNPAAAALGVKFQDVTAALASMTAQGV